MCRHLAAPHSGLKCIHVMDIKVLKGIGSYKGYKQGWVMTSLRLAECASFPVWKTLVGQRGCPLFGWNQSHLSRNPQNFY
jgi:hypothetical protein